jgi:hypothetical protein
MGRMDGDLLVLGDGPLAGQARMAAGAALRPVIQIEGSTVADFRKSFLALLPPYASFSAPKQSPFHAARRLTGLAPTVLCGGLDAKSRIASHCYRHPQAGALTIDFEGGWVSTEQPLATVVNALVDDAWQSLPLTKHFALRYSLESVIWFAVLRWRSELGTVDPFPWLRICDFPDIAVVTGQAGLHEAVFAWREMASIETLVARTSIGTDLATTIATAAALTGLVEIFPSPPTIAAQTVIRPQVRTSAFARLAHFLGLSTATARDFP